MKRTNRNQKNFTESEVKDIIEMYTTQKLSSVKIGENMVVHTKQYFAFWIRIV